MKVLIWFVSFFLLVFFQTILSGMGISLGAIPTMFLFAAAWYTASSLSKAYDRRKENRKKAEPESPAPFDEPTTPFISDGNEPGSTIRTGITNPRKLILPVTCCMIVLLLALLIVLLMPKPAAPVPTEPASATVVPTVTQAPETESATSAPTEIPLPPDSLSENYGRDFRQRYSEGDLKTLFNTQDITSDYSMFSRAQEEIYAKFFKSGFNDGWADFYADEIDSSILDEEYDVLTDSVRNIAYADGYLRALSILTK